MFSCFISWFKHVIKQVLHGKKKKNKNFCINLSKGGVKLIVLLVLQQEHSRGWGSPNYRSKPVTLVYQLLDPQGNVLYCQEPATSRALSFVQNQWRQQ